MTQTLDTILLYIAKKTWTINWLCQDDVIFSLRTFRPALVCLWSVCQVQLSFFTISLGREGRGKTFLCHFQPWSWGGGLFFPLLYADASCARWADRRADILFDHRLGFRQGMWKQSNFHENRVGKRFRHENALWLIITYHCKAWAPEKMLRTVRCSGTFF